MDKEDMDSIWEYPSLVKGSGDVDFEDFEDSYTKDIKHFLKKIEVYSKTIYPIASRFNSVEKKRFIFVSSRYRGLIKDLTKDVILFGGVKDIFFALKNQLTYYGLSKVTIELYNIFLKHDLHFESLESQRLLEDISNLLVEISPEFLVVSNDSLFLERFLIYIARKNGIKSICLQHGLFFNKSDFRSLNGHFVDYMFVWGESQAQIYLENGYDRDRLRIIGYPFKRDKAKVGKIDRNSVCILGQPFEIYSKKLGKKKKEIVERVSSILGSNGFKVYYKPHPGEKDLSYYPDNVEIFRSSITNALNRFDIFISLTSTASLEASLYGKISIQIYDPVFNCDNFQTIGYSYSINIQDMEPLPEYINSLELPFNVLPSNILVVNNIGERFISIVNNLW